MNGNKRKEMTNKKEKIYVQMFKDFLISYHDAKLGDDEINSPQLLKLLAYIIINHKHKVSFDELIELLWYFDDSENPDHALRNLMYRLRKLIRQKLQIKNLILTEKGFYYFNSFDYEAIIDAELFDAYCDQINEKSNQKDYQLCLNYYQGKLLPMMSDDIHFLTKQNYYHSLYIDMFNKYSDWLEKDDNYQELKTISENALKIDRYEETFHYSYVNALYLLGQYKEAIEAYDHITNLFYHSLGVNLSDKMRDLYEQVKEKETQNEIDIVEILDELNLQGNHPGAYICNFETFKNIYVNQIRLIDRLGICTQICLVTLDNSYQREINDEKSKYIEKVMQSIQSSLEKGLRASDIVSRVNAKQFVVMLPICNSDNASQAIERSLKKIKKSLRNRNLSLNYAIREIQLDR